MNRFCWLVAVLCLVAFCAQAQDVCRARAQVLLQALQRGDDTTAVAHFDTRMQAALDARKLGGAWTALTAQMGGFDHAAAVREDVASGQALIVTPLHFAHGWLAMRVACDASGQVSGLYFVPTVAPHDEAEPWAADEHALAVPSPLGPLKGILTLPAGAGPFPAVLLVAGSGPHDADETIGPNKPFRDLAQGLAAAGIASLRYDKRTFDYAATMAQDSHVTIDQEVTDDALSAARLLAAQPRIDPHRVFLLGHSLGAMLAPRIAHRDPSLAGIILLAAPARPLLDVIAQQVREVDARAGVAAAQITASEQAIDTERKRLAAADPAHPPAGAFGGAPQSYWLSLRDYDQVAAARELKMPMLVVQGGADFQVSPTDDLARWRQALAGRTDVTFRLYPGLSHLFMPAGLTGTVKDYQTPAHMDAGVVRDITAWIRAHPARQQ